MTGFYETSRSPGVYYQMFPVLFFLEIKISPREEYNMFIFSIVPHYQPDDVCVLKCQNKTNIHGNKKVGDKIWTKNGHILAKI